ncbi:prepilin-type cleavage/methylation domain-containing protein [Wohlfahrtiimonas chitiniclastica]|uniref:pilus assembly FimT family protein n=1 Tax=Wohlfahrtiimonas chitiniclastica TaxID=400946 RepID=UPI000B989E99|nr:prepilin-type N-terminal cleavage/methylation domain-containing protein [Wohlfahrtiimonas chitiniclastica]OYQ87269.1 prepilin-type cleavage/methylation domain-containing protein [Wohlfahrtiimonas chitiniclastica]
MRSHRTLHSKGYTLIELMITLVIFAIIALFGLPAFYAFLGKSDMKNQVAQAANFLRSAQEIATATNRTVYVYTEGYKGYDAANKAQKESYWNQPWIMSFKPVGRDFVTFKKQEDELLKDNSPYEIARQRVFKDNGQFNIYTLESAMNASNGLISEPSGIYALNGYRSQNGGKPGFLKFSPSGEVTLPIFVIAKKGKNYSFTSLSAKWRDVFDGTYKGFAKGNSTGNVVALLGGCRTHQGKIADTISYTFNQDAMLPADLFAMDSANKFSPAFAFGNSACHSVFMQ